MKTLHPYCHNAKDERIWKVNVPKQSSQSMSISTKYTSNRNTYSVHKMPSTSTYFEEYYEYPLSKPLLLSIWIAWPAMRKHWPKTTFYQLLSFFVIVLAFFWILLLLYGNAVQAALLLLPFPLFSAWPGRPTEQLVCYAIWYFYAKSWLIWQNV